MYPQKGTGAFWVRKGGNSCIWAGICSSSLGNSLEDRVSPIGFQCGCATVKFRVDHKFDSGTFDNRVNQAAGQWQPLKSDATTLERERSRLTLPPCQPIQLSTRLKTQARANRSCQWWEMVKWRTGACLSHRIRGTYEYSNRSRN